MRVLIIDNFDSFTNNIAQYVYEVSGVLPTVLPNSTPFADLKLEQYAAIILSPGPGHPANAADFGVCDQVLACATIPILGICLGLQGINHHFGGKVEHAPKPVHGYRSKITHSGTGLFAGIPQQFEVIRYHSLVCTDVAENLDVTARSEDGLIMALTHREKKIMGVQFHPESIDSTFGHQIIGNFFRLVNQDKIPDYRLSNIERLKKALVIAAGQVKIDFSYRQLTEFPDPANTFKYYFEKSLASFWLDSEYSDQPNARYSLMGSCDSTVAILFSYDVTNKILTIEGSQGSSQIEGDVFQLMDDVIQLLKPTENHQVPFPFKGGLIGYLGYELKALNNIKNAHVSELPDALFYLPQNAIIFDHHSKMAYLCHIWGENFIFDTVPTHDNPPVDVKFVAGSVPETQLYLQDNSTTYIDKIKTCLQKIDDGESYEICLTNRARLPLEDAPFPTYLRMRKISPVPYGAYLQTDRCAILSASPETFLTINSSGKVTSKPIKGTRPRGTTDQQDAMLKTDLALSAKDRAENLMIVDLVRHDLNHICIPGSVNVPKIFDIETYSSVHQMVSTIEGQLRIDIGSFNAIKACFPGGSMTGAPKIRTMEIIDELESCARGIYSGALGWIGFDGYVDLSIVIRTAVITNGMAEFGIGGAIVAASDPVEEMQETLVKASVPFRSIKTARESV